MELTKQELNARLKEAREAGYIIPNQVNRALKLYKESGDVSILEYIEEQKKAFDRRNSLNRKQWYELTEAEALQRIVKQNSIIINNLSTVKSWVTFIGIIILLGLVGTILMMSSISL